MDQALPSIESVVQLLLIEDDEEDYILTRAMLAETTGYRYRVTWAADYASGVTQIRERSYDIILLDYQLGMHTGLELIHEADALGCKTPIILLTGRGNFEIDIEAMHAGATDYLAKGEVTSGLLERAIRYAILRRQNEETLRNINENLEQRVRERTQALEEKNLALEAEIIERQRVQSELAEVRRRLLDRAEADRRELARDLHDGPMQDLYGVIFAVDLLLEDEMGREELKNRLLGVIQNLRAITRDLRPPTLAPYGLQKAIQSHIDTLSANHPLLKIETELDADGQTLSEPVRMALYRIYQVAVTNVLRHADANKVTIRLKMTSEHVTLEVQDNGQGFNVPERWLDLARTGHLGLAGAAERAEAVGGSFTVESLLGQGSLIRVSVPRAGA